MANWFTNALDVVTPWNRKGEVQRRVQTRKKKKDEENQTTAPQFNRPSPVEQLNQSQPKPQRPENLFAGLNENLKIGKPRNAVTVAKTPDVEPAPTPIPGQVVRPNQSFGNKIRDQFDANTQADQYRRDQANTRKGENKPIILDKPGNIISRTPVVGTATKQLNTLATQIASAPATIGQQFAVREQSAATEEYQKAVKSGDKNRIAKAKQRTNDAINRVDDYNRQQEAGHSMFEKNKGGLFNTGTLYDEKGSKSGDIKTGVKDVALPTAVAALDLYTLGKGNLISEQIAKNGFKTGVTASAPNIAKAAGGNFQSGALNTYSEGGNSIDAGKAGLINSILGLVPDVGIPALFRGFKNKVVPGITRGRGVTPEVVVDELDDAAISASAEAANQALKPKPIRVDAPQETPVKVPVKTPVTDNPYLIPRIKEIGGDFNFPKMEELQQIRVADARKAADDFNATARPDPRVEGIIPRRTTEPYKLSADAVKNSQDDLIDQYATFLKDIGEGNGVDILPDGRRVSNNVRFGDTGGKRMTKAEWRAEAERQLKAGKADPSLQKTFDDAADPEVQSMLARGEQPEVPEGRPNGRLIKVKEAKSIPVRDETVIPTNLPETPGQVRVTEAKSPNNVKSEVVAQQLPPIPKVGSTLPNGTIVTKRMVQSARNQRKNARALAKAQEQTATAMEQVNAKNTPNAALDGRQPGLILSEDIKKGKKGPYQVAHQADQANELGDKSVSQVIQEAEASKVTHGSLNDRDIANVKAALDSGTYKAGTPEYKKLSDLYWKDAGTHSGQQLALRNQSMHRTGSAKEIYNRAVSKIVALADDPSKITDEMIGNIEKTVDDFVNVRDARLKAADDFNANPTKETHDRFIKLDKEAAKTEKAMAMSQYTAAKKSLKGNTNVKLRRLIEDAADDADMYTMDFVDSALLSSTGTFVRNFTNATLGSAEEGLFGGIGARVGRGIKRTSIGGGAGRGSLSGFGKGVSNIVDASKTRFKDAGWNPIEHMKNWSTTGNQLGDSMIEGSIGRSVRNHYEQLLKKQGYTGDELRMRADVMARTDPDKLAETIYAPQARKDAGLGSGISKRSSIEKGAQREIADGIARIMGKEYSQGGENFAKGLTRITMGFPSAIGRSLVAGAQRVVPFANIDTVKAFTAPDATLRAAAIKESIKKSGTAATAATIFGVMGANDMITGAYPKDPNERARWEREGIKENSIKIGDAWYDAPSYLGSFGVPVLAWASVGRNGGINKESLSDIKAILGSISPTENISDINDALDGKIDLSKYTQRVAASVGRMATPYGSLLNQISKVFDTTQNDTSGDSWAEGLFNKLIDGIPFVDKVLPDKTDKEGNTLYNPSVVETMVGASGAVQKGGEQRSAEINAETNSIVDKIDKYGLLNDKNLDGVLEGTSLEAYNKTKTGKQLDESEIKSLKEGLVKGVTGKEDTAYLEREQYDTNLAVLKLKRDLMKADKTVKPSALEDIDVSIKRGQIYKDGKVPYDMIDSYKSTSLTDWRKMGDPESDEYDPEMYQKLWAIDETMAKAGVSYAKGKLDKQKYSAKESKGKGGGGRGGSKGNFSADFGTLKAGSFTPDVQSYQSIDQKSGVVPHIAVKRPNIVHKIGSSG